MSTELKDQIQRLQASIAALEAQRDTRGDEAVEAGLVLMRTRLAELQGELPEQQRKQVTLLFMDVVGSTRMVAHLDPEDALAIMDSALKRLETPVQAHGGHVARFMGDGFIAVFGAPVAHEHDPQQAVLAGLAILAEVLALANELEAGWNIPSFRVRIGINTGKVAVGGLTELDDTYMGAAVNLAARLESAAPPGKILISHDTYRHVRGLFDIQPAGELQAKGFDEPVQVYQVLRAKERSFHLPVRGVEGVETRLVGRQAELKILQEALLNALEEGEGGVITLVGEAGVGKSRLWMEFQEWLELQPQVMELYLGRAAPEAQHLPYALLRDVFTSRFQIQDSDPADVAKSKLEAGLLQVFGDQMQGQIQAHLVGHLLGFDFSASPHLLGAAAETQVFRNRALQAMEAYFRAAAGLYPLVICLEDLHWADDSSLDALNQLSHLVPKQPILIVCLARPNIYERRPYWGEGLAYHQRLALAPLTKAYSRQLVIEILQRVEIVPDRLRDLVVEAAEGNPFYLEELVKMLIEDGVIVTGEGSWQIALERLEHIKVPSTLTGVLQARLDSLPLEERTVLQQASVVGRLFWDQTVAHLHVSTSNQETEKEVEGILENLRGRELVYRKEESAFSEAVEYIFKHDVLREVTYETLLKRLRRVYHRLVAEWLIEHGGGRLGEFAGLIAGHLETAGENERAAAYFRFAGQQALSTYANLEAQAYFQRGLALGPANEEQTALLTGLGEALFGQSHFAEAVQAWQEAIPLYQRLGNSDRVSYLYARIVRATDHMEAIADAIRISQVGLATQSDTSESVGLARLLHEAARVYYLGANQAAHMPGIKVYNREDIVAMCERALVIAGRLGAVDVEAEALCTLGILRHLSLEQRVDTLQQAAQLAEAHGLLFTAWRAYNSWGISGIPIREARPYLWRSLEIARQIGFAYYQLYSLVNLIVNLLYTGEIDKAEEIYQEMLLLRDRVLDNQEFRISCEQTLAEIYFTRGAWQEALPLIKTDFERVSPLDIFVNLEYLLVVDRVLHPLDLSPYLEYLLQDPEKYPGWRENVAISCVISSLCAQVGQFEAAAGWLASAQMAANPENELDLSNLTEAEFVLRRLKRDWEAALRAGKRRLELGIALNMETALALAYLELGDIYQQRSQPGDRECARAHYEKALEKYTRMGAPGYLRALEKRLATLT